MAKSKSGPTIENLQDAYRKLTMAISLYLETETNLQEAIAIFTKANELRELSYTKLINILQGKEEADA